MDIRYAVNCSILFKELPLLERPAAAKAAGFDAVEFWWPFPTAVPDDGEVEQFERAVRDAGVELIGLNFFAGDMAAGERGIVSHPGRVEEFRDNVAAAAGIGRDLGCRAFNALYGNRVPDVDTATQDTVAAENLAFAGRAVAPINGTVLLEPVSGSEGYPLLTADDVMSVIDRVRDEHAVENVGFLCDFYHLATNGDDLARVVERYGARAAHVQIADAPGRHEPGTGSLDLSGYVAEVLRAGYDGWVALEYVPSGRTEDSFGWLRADGA